MYGRPMSPPFAALYNRREAAKKVGNVHYLGLQYCEGARLTRIGRNAADLFAIYLGPMDDEGYFNFGPPTGHIGSWRSTA